MIGFLNFLKLLLKIGPILYDLVKLAVKIVQEWKKLKPAKQTIKEYRRDQQKKKTTSGHPP